MVISPKKRKSSPFFMSTLGIMQPNLKSFYGFHLNLKVELSHKMQKYDQIIFAFTQQSNSSILEF